MTKKYIWALLLMVMCSVAVSAKGLKKSKGSNNISIDPKYPIELLGQMVQYNGQYLQIDNRHLLVCPNLSDTVVYNHHFIYKTLKDAFADVPEELTNDGDIYVYLTPGVHWVDKRTPNEIKIADMQMHNGVPTSITFACHDLHIVGLNPNPENVVIAGNRGNMRGAVGDYAMFYLHTMGLFIENVTMGNYCNVDLKFPLDHRLDYEHITSQATQAQIAMTLANHLYAVNCRFIGNEKATPPMGHRTLFNNCFFEVGDMPLPLDAVFLNCDITWHSNDIFKTMFHSVFLNSKIYTETASIWQFYENPQAFLTMVDCEVHEDDIDRANMGDKVATMASSDRCYFSNVKYNGETMAISPDHKLFVDGGDVSNMKNVLSGYYSMVQDRKVYNTYDLLRGTDNWDPMSVKSFFEDESTKVVKPFRFAGCLEIRATDNRLKYRRILPTDKVDNVYKMVLKARYAHISSNKTDDIKEHLTWTLDPRCNAFVKVVEMAGDSCVLDIANKSYREQNVIIKARTDEGLEALCSFIVQPEQFEAPSFASKPQIVLNSNNTLELKYKLRNAGDDDNSVVRWLRCKDAKTNGICVSANHGDTQLTTYKLTAADNGYYIKAKIAPRCKNSKSGKTVIVGIKKPINVQPEQGTNHVFFSDFENLPTSLQKEAIPGFWMQDYYVPRDSASFKWMEEKPAYNPWRYEAGRGAAAGFNGFNQQGRGARIVYIPDTLTKYSPDMEVTFLITSSKGQGQGVAQSGEYIDLFVQYDPVTSTGYGVRLQRWADYNRAITYTIMKYRNGFATPISRSALSNCFIGDCYTTISIKGRDIAVKSFSTYPVDMRKRTDDVNSEVLLTATINPMPYRAFGVHSMSASFAPILLRDIKCEWGSPETPKETKE